ncbi:MAG TPA: hypothetical protein VJT54_09235 [Verrucomicrobiae bacterium]|nr:hypothetical protein [Verrucomicrobiae bacterium]
MPVAPYPMQTVGPLEAYGPRERPDRAKRFTLDGSNELENHLTRVCGKVLAGVQKIIPPPKLEALVLGGGYGRGEGGVLKTGNGDRPYNDLEFYAFLRGNRFWNERKFHPALHELGEQLSPEAGLQVEFKVDSLAHLRHGPVTMFSYDLVAAHRVLSGNTAPFIGCEHHLNAGNISLSEATRLLMNRCSGLLFAREKLAPGPFSAEDADFVGRNIAKAQLAFGDVVLTVFGQYHWSCRERRERLRRFSPPERLPWLDEARRHHDAGVEFKLSPQRIVAPRAELELRLADTTAFALPMWLWLENRRLGCCFASAQDYASSPVNKCPDSHRWRNYLLNAGVFGPAIFLCANCHRHPRERIFNTLAMLLWEIRPKDSDLRRQLRPADLLSGDDTKKWVAVYQSLWSHFN